MSVARAEADGGRDSWSAAESAVLAESVHCAPSVHNTRPWELALHGRTAELRERTVLAAQHDPEGRDRRISLGAALANLALAIRGLGWAAEAATGSADDLVTATVVGTRRSRPTDAENRRRRVLADRRSHRHSFDRRELPDGIRDALLDALAAPGVTGRWISGPDEALAVARLLDYAARVFRDNAEYQRDLTLWATPRGSGVRPDAFGAEGLAAVGLTTSRTRLPDESLLADRIQREAVLVIATSADTPQDHVRAGAAMEQAWLEAASRDLAASVMTQPLHLEEVRTGLAQRLGLTAVPQMLMRFGLPVEPEVGDR
ncbi:Nitroreductase family protein [Saccharopolyspora shandongensis]|uniref:Nitroreductase family protein n=1 Tax=Saccharopolyspora shandongensis TaxID=418495 RepID=A0A1H3EAN7_9PSEU|nr:nitroreductase family protein [Saccharopolyspora shandongensis]SDX75308.1 Nitroreductase family protein [Saccharopolyspora shandongensis]